MYLPQGTEHLKSCEVAGREALKLAEDASYPSKWRNYSTAYICGYGSRMVAESVGIYAYTT